ncbi:MAG: UDP-N-acetylmuramate dehydrogenase [Acidimicrobiia bacterium]|nr:UDP-N-acetylmuramate dehydrogenase [Acidimicrobiia bacterium]MCY4457752.1 UDP-N-acetylmuramate dehydrogenase [Acidimicrobiaceae bacterium]
MNTPKIATELRAALDALGASSLSAKVQFDAPLGNLTTYRVGGNAVALVVVDSHEEITLVTEAIATSGILTDVPIAVIGRGSNLLVSDEGFAGIAIMLGQTFSAIRIVEHTVVVGGAAKMPVVARATVNAELGGFEWAVGIPGSVGGAVCMNAGGHGAAMQDTLTSAEIVDLRSGRFSWRSNRDLAFGYRTSSVGANELVLTACLELSMNEKANGKTLMNEIVQWRRTNQPGGQNAGSVFTNPHGDSAGSLIESTGAKGLRLGTAQVSPKHANFICAEPDGRAADIRALMNEIQRRVLDTHNVKLTFETQLLGFNEQPQD